MLFWSLAIKNSSGSQRWKADKQWVAIKSWQAAHGHNSSYFKSQKEHCQRCFKEVDACPWITLNGPHSCKLPTLTAEVKKFILFKKATFIHYLEVFKHATFFLNTATKSQNMWGNFFVFDIECIQLPLS